MDGHTDWLSFTFEVEQEPNGYEELYHMTRALLRKVSHEHETYLFDGQGMEPAVSRAPYRFSLARNDQGFRCFGGSHTQTIACELSGRACEGLHDPEAARGFIAPIAERVTRWDYAVDVRTATNPSEFINARSHKGFRSVSYIKSDSGETCYCGSPKSDRFARVYRYAHPHPRAALLRSEFVFRKGYAKDAVRLFVELEDEGEFVSRLGNTWGWAHECWKPAVKTDERVSTTYNKQEDDQTLRWLYSQVMPAMRRLMVAGALDMTAFLTELYETADKERAAAAID